MTEIVKVHCPVLPRGAPALIYPKECMRALISIGDHFPDKKITRQPLDAASRRAMNGSVEGYFKASFVGGKWKLGRRVQDQGW